MEESKSFKRVKYSEQMIKEYLGEEWNFKFRKMRRTHGRCNHSKKVITLNLKLIIEGMDYFFDSVLFHEISHALAYPNCGHCFREFKSWCEYFNAHKNRCIAFNAEMSK